MNDEARLENLLERHVDGVLTEAELRELEDMLRVSPKAREAFWRHAKWNVALRSCGESVWGASGGEPGDLTSAAARLGRWSLVERLRRFAHRWAGRAAAVAGLAIAAAAVIAFTLVERKPSQAAARTEVFTGGYDERSVPMPDVAVRRSRDLEQRLSVTTLRTQTPARLFSVNGAVVDVSGDAIVGLTSPTAGALYSGRLACRGQGTSGAYSVLAADLRIVDKGANFRAHKVDEHQIEVHVEKGSVDIESRVRVPVALWSFDAIDAVTRRAAGLGGEHELMLSSCVDVVDGAVGSGALRFDNSLASYGVVDGGTGPRVGDGTLSAVVGITIEALVKVEWSGEKSDNDAIFRKEDGQYNVLLAFQNDSPHWDALREPAVDAEQCLSFGLHLAGHGYRELDMPLDGREGRPSLAALRDGRFHHVVATFDSFSGRKCIYIDGELAMEWQYPRGTIILSGGPAPAFVGSSVGQENFTGCIDEVAFYDFALTPAEIADHASRARAGRPYHDDLDGDRPQQRWRSIRRLAAAESGVFDERSPSGG